MTGTRLGPTGSRRVLAAAGWSLLPLAAAAVVARSVADHPRLVLVLGVVVALGLFVLQLRERPTTVTDTEVRLARRTIPREGVVAVTTTAGGSAYVFRDASGAPLGIWNVWEDAPAAAAALAEHGWPPVTVEGRAGR